MNTVQAKLDGPRILLDLTMSDLTNREREVLYYLAVRGMRPQEVADHLVVSYDTIRTHEQAIHRKLTLSTLAQITTLVWSSGWAERLSTERTLRDGIRPR